MTSVNMADLDSKLEKLLVSLTTLQIQQSEGFKGVHERQDRANGKLLRHETEIRAIESKHSGDILEIKGQVDKLIDEHQRHNNRGNKIWEVVKPAISGLVIALLLAIWVTIKGEL